MRKLLTFLFIGIFIASFISCNDKEEIIQEPIITEQPEGYYFEGNPNEKTKQLVLVIYQGYVSFGSKIIIPYDPEGNIYDFKGFLPHDYETKFIFDLDGNLVEYEIDPQLSFYFSYSNNNTIGVATDGLFEWKLEIDHNLNLIYFYSSEITSGNISGNKYEYNENNKITKEEWWQDGVIVESIFTEYKPNGNVLKTFNSLNVYSSWFEYNSDSLLIWECIVTGEYDDNPENDIYELKWYNDNSIIIREEERTVRDSALLWFAINDINELGQQKYSSYVIKKDFGINLDNPYKYRYNGDTILSNYHEIDENGNTLKQLISTWIGNSEEDITKYYFLHVMVEFNDQGNEIAKYYYSGDFRYNIVEYSFGNYEYNETHGKIMQRTQYDANNIPVYNFTYEYEYNTSSGEYDFYRLNCFDAQTDELLWYYDKDWIKRNPDGSLY